MRKASRSFSLKWSFTSSSLAVLVAASVGVGSAEALASPPGPAAKAAAPAPKRETFAPSPAVKSLAHIAIGPEQKPAPGKKAPLVIVLHGLGDTEKPLSELVVNQMDKRFFVVSVRAPFPNPTGGFAWFNVDPGTLKMSDETQPAASLAKLSAFIDEVKKAYPVDPGKVFLFGYSQGAMMAEGLVLTEPAKVKGMVACSGKLLPAFSEKAQPAAKLRGKPVLVIHGMADKKIPLAEGRAAVDAMKKASMDVQSREFNMGHDINAEALQAITAWFATQLK